MAFVNAIRRLLARDGRTDMMIGHTGQLSGQEVLGVDDPSANNTRVDYHLRLALLLLQYSENVDLFI